MARRIPDCKTAICHGIKNQPRVRRASLSDCPFLHAGIKTALNIRGAGVFRETGHDGGWFFLIRRQGRSACRKGGTSAGQLRVMGHQMVSRRKFLPRPLSPVSRFRRLPKSSSMPGAGPTLDRVRCVIKPKAPRFSGSEGGAATAGGAEKCAGYFNPFFFMTWMRSRILSK